MLLQNLIGLKENLVFVGEELDELDNFDHLGSCTSFGSNKSDAVFSSTHGLTGFQRFEASVEST